MMRVLYTLVFGSFALLTTLGAVYAQPPPVSRVGADRVARTPAFNGPQHRFFGLLVSAHDPMLLLRLRNGSLLRVDASQAFARQRVSEPLFVGKPTVVEGSFEAAGTFGASVVTRAAPSATAWGADH